MPRNHPGMSWQTWFKFRWTSESMWIPSSTPKNISQWCTGNWNLSFFCFLFSFPALYNCFSHSYQLLEKIGKMRSNAWLPPVLGHATLQLHGGHKGTPTETSLTSHGPSSPKCSFDLAINTHFYQDRRPNKKFNRLAPVNMVPELSLR